MRAPSRKTGPGPALPSLGAALGSFICYVCPAMLYVKAVEKSKGKDSPEYKQAAASKLLIPFGVIIGGLGILITIQSAMEN